MTHSPVPSRAFRMVPLALLMGMAAQSAAAHEAWLLTPAEIEALAVAPMPAIFKSYLVLGPAALVALIATCVALFIEERLAPLEARIDPILSQAATTFAPATLRLGLASMLLLAGTGGLPRHGTAPWLEPTLFVPDMQLSIVAGWDWLAPLQIALAILLVAGLFTRLAGVVLIALSALGLMIFGTAFLSYAPHFAAPGLVLVVVGGGTLSLDARMGLDDLLAPVAGLRQPLWRAAQILFGAGFVYLAVAYKLTQPTLLIAILDHGDFPSFGMPYEVIALVMTGVEIICGALLVMGRLVRPVSLTIIGAITFLAITLGETPLFHANLYGTMVMFALAGRTLPSGRPFNPFFWRTV